MIDFKIDEGKCIKCKLCVQECPVLIIDAKTEFPEIKEGKEENCIKCQHCLAVCPTAALSIWGKKPKDSVLVTDEIPQPEEMSRLIKTRRSVRKFKKDELGKEFVYNLLETAAYAPTGVNSNAVLFSVIDNKEDLSKLRQVVYNRIKKAKEEGRLPENREFLFNLQQLWENKKIDVVFRDAPHVLIVSAPNSISTPDADCYIAMSYFELLANSHGIGTLWNGFIKWVIRDVDPEIREIIGIPEDHYISVAMLFGKPAVKYSRAVQSDGLNLNRVSL